MCKSELIWIHELTHDKLLLCDFAMELFQLKTHMSYVFAICILYSWDTMDQFDLMLFEIETSINQKMHVHAQDETK